MTRIRRAITARQFIEALHAEGFEFYRHPDGRRAVVAFHSLHSTFPIGTLKGMIQDAGWSQDDLVRLGLAG